MMKFGRLRWSDTPVAMSAQEVAVPVGANCVRCEETIERDDAGYEMPLITLDGVTTTALHEECFLRQAVGSIAHQNRVCSCFVPGASDGDPETLSRRDAARLAVAHFEATRR